MDKCTTCGHDYGEHWGFRGLSENRCHHPECGCKRFAAPAPTVKESSPVAPPTVRDSRKVAEDEERVLRNACHSAACLIVEDDPRYSHAPDVLYEALRPYLVTPATIADLRERLARAEDGCCALERVLSATLMRGKVLESELAAMKADHTHFLLEVLVTLAGAGICTPERGYAKDGGLRAALTAIREMRDRLTSERDEARRERDYCDKSMRRVAEALGLVPEVAMWCADSVDMLVRYAAKDHSALAAANALIAELEARVQDLDDTLASRVVEVGAATFDLSATNDRIHELAVRPEHLHRELSLQNRGARLNARVIMLLSEKRLAAEARVAELEATLAEKRRDIEAMRASFFRLMNTLRARAGMRSFASLEDALKELTNAD